MTAMVPMTVAMMAGMNRGEKETSAVMLGYRQKSQGKYNPLALDTYSICGANVMPLMTVCDHNIIILKRYYTILLDQCFL